MLPVLFTIGGLTIHSYGIAAKELHAKAKFLVEAGHDDEEVTNDTLEHPYKINTQSLIAFMLQSIKELKLENNDLKRRLELLETKRV